MRPADLHRPGIGAGSGKVIYLWLKGNDGLARRGLDPII